MWDISLLVFFLIIQYLQQWERENYWFKLYMSPLKTSKDTTQVTTLLAQISWYSSFII